MTWFKVDDKLHDHHKVRGAGKSAMGVWVLAGSWSADNLTDGFIPRSVLTRWGSRFDAARLVAAGLWYETSKNDEPGWVFHEWETYQPTSTEVQQRRTEARERMKRIRDVRTNKRRSSEEVPYARPDPTRPVTTQSVVTHGDVVVAFEKFWSSYPRKIGKGSALKAFEKAAKNVDTSELIEGAARFAEWCASEQIAQRFTPHPSTWLNAGRWADELRASSRSKSTTDDRVTAALDVAKRLREQETTTARKEIT